MSAPEPGSELHPSDGGERDVDGVIARIEHELTVLLRRAEVAGGRKALTEQLTRSGYLLLAALENHGPLGIAALADVTHVDISTASRQIGPLERHDLVHRLPNPADKRGSLIAITPVGRTRLHATHQERLTAFRDLLRDWPETDRAAFAAYLARLNDAIIARERARNG